MKNKKGIIVFIGVIIVAVLTTVGQMFMPQKPQTKKSASKKSPLSFYYSTGKSKNHKSSAKGDYIAKLYITGEIMDDSKEYNQQWLLETISDLKADEKNKAIFLFIDSPGGSVYQADEAYLALMDYKESGKPVYAYLASLAASGGYYIACSADYITANRNTLTGSIGVICGQFTDLTGLMEKYGIKSTTIHAGRNKTMGSLNEPMTLEQQQIMQSIADECYEQFTDIVASSRSLTKDVVYTLADGRIYTAKQALDVKLIDSIGTFDDAVKTMERKLFDYEELEVIDYEYEKDESFYDLLMGAVKEFKKSAVTPVLPKTVEEAISTKVPFPAYLYK